MKKVLILQIVLCALLLTACGETKEEFNETTVSVGKKGEVTEYIISAFDKDYYKEQDEDAKETKKNQLFHYLSFYISIIRCIVLVLSFLFF